MSPMAPYWWLRPFAAEDRESAEPARKGAREVARRKVRMVSARSTTGPWSELLSPLQLPNAHASCNYLIHGAK